MKEFSHYSYRKCDSFQYQKDNGQHSFITMLILLTYSYEHIDINLI